MRHQVGRYGLEPVVERGPRRHRRGRHPVRAAVGWVGAHPSVTAPITGARSVEQLQASLDSVKIDMTPALRAEIAALSRTPPPATDRLEEQATAKV